MKNVYTRIIGKECIIDGLLAVSLCRRGLAAVAENEMKKKETNYEH